MPEGDTPAREVVRRHFNRDTIPLQHPNAEPPHIPSERGKHLVPAVHGNAERRVGEDIDDRALELDGILFCHRVYNGLTHELASTTRPTLQSRTSRVPSRITSCKRACASVQPLLRLQLQHRRVDAVAGSL